MRKRFTNVVLAIVATLAITLHHLSIAGQDWPQWRGPTRDGRVPATNTPASWPESFRQVWRVEVGEGFSSPVVVANLVFVRGRQDPDEVVRALGLGHGRVLWKKKYAAPCQKNQSALRIARGP